MNLTYFTLFAITNFPKMSLFFIPIRRQITKALEFDNVQRLRRDGRNTLNSLEERSQWLASSKDVQRAKTYACDSFNAVERVTKRLEHLKQERMDHMKELAKFRNLQEDGDEVSYYLLFLLSFEILKCLNN